MAHVYGGGFNVVEPPIAYESVPVARPRRKVIRYPEEYPIYHSDPPVVRRRLNYVAPVAKNRPVIVKRSFAPPPEHRMLREPYYESEYLDEVDYLYPPNIPVAVEKRPFQTAPAYINYKMKSFLPPIADVNRHYNYPEFDYDWYHRDIVRDNSQTYLSDDGLTFPPVIKRRVAPVPRYSVPDAPRFYYHKPVLQPRRAYVDDYDNRSMVPVYRPRRDQYRAYDRIYELPTDDYQNKKIRYLMQQRRQQGLQ